MVICHYHIQRINMVRKQRIINTFVSANQRQQKVYISSKQYIFSASTKKEEEVARSLSLLFDKAVE